MSTNLSYSVADFVAFTKIVSADMNAKLDDIKSRVNWAGGTDATTGLGDDNIQSNTASGGGLTRATKLKKGTANYAIYNDGTGAMTEAASLPTTSGGLGFNPSLTGNAGLAVVVNNGETGLALGSPLQGSLTESFSNDVVTLTAGETIAANDSVCLDLHNGTGSYVYRVFRTDSDVATRRANFLGFATGAATVVAGIYTYTASAAFVASNVITTTINGRTYATTYASSSDATLQAVATQIATDTDVASAIVTVITDQLGSNDRVITVTSKGGLSLTMSAVVTAGVSQPTITVAQTQAPSGQNVKIQCFGPLAGFSGLTTGSYYYVSDQLGAATATPSDLVPIFVGQALSSTVLFINRNAKNFTFTTSQILVRSHGTTNRSSGVAAKADVEIFNETTWGNGTSDSISRYSLGSGEATLGGFHIVVDGIDTAEAVTAALRKFNKLTWAAGSNRTTPRQNSGPATLGSILYMGKGSSDTAASGGFSNLDSYDGSTWSNGIASFANNSSGTSTFTQNGRVHWALGVSTAGAGQDLHETYNGASISSQATLGLTDGGMASSACAGSNGIAGANAGTTNESYVWNGTTWGSNADIGIKCTSSLVQNTGPGIGFLQGSGKTYINGGSTGATVAIKTTVSFNGVSWSLSPPDSTNARMGSQGSAT